MRCHYQKLRALTSVIIKFIQTIKKGRSNLRASSVSATVACFYSTAIDLAIIVRVFLDVGDYYCSNANPMRRIFHTTVLRAMHWVGRAWLVGYVFTAVCLLALGYSMTPGHLLPGNVNVTYRLNAFKRQITHQSDGEQNSLIAFIDVSNGSNNPLWYFGSGKGVPYLFCHEFSNGVWTRHEWGVLPGKDIYFPNSENFEIQVGPLENIDRFKVGIAVRSSWFGWRKQIAWSGEIVVPQAKKYGVVSRQSN